MAIQLQHSVFIHIPKTGGRWAKTMIQNAVKGYSFIGDPIYDAHASPDTDLPVFAFVRHPIAMANSLWHHRSRKHSNARHKDWNWQQDIRLERECGCDDYQQFFKNIANHPLVLTDYFEHFVKKYDKIYLGKLENAGQDLVKILNTLGEEFDENYIMQNSMNMVGKASKPIDLDKGIIKTIMRNEEEFCRKFGYTEDNL